MTDLPRVSPALPHPLLACSLALLLPLTSACDGSGATTGPADPTGAAPTDEPVADPPPEAEPAGGPRLRTVYVPAYSVLPRGTNLDRSALLSVLLSVRNVDSTATVTLTHVDYFDTSGHRVRRYLDAPRRLRPLETAEFTVETNDATGGSGANFLVYWEGPSDAHPLLTETVMVGHLGSGHVAFTSRGVELDRRPNPSSFEAEESPASGSAQAP
ncbi:MAG: DUF3124 domain-containing protein [Polyangiales bacterium]